MDHQPSTINPCAHLSRSCVSAGKEIETVMTVATRMILILLLMLAFTGGLSAQETSTAAETSGTTATAATETAAAETESTTTGEDREAAARPRTGYEVRNQFTSLLRDSYPPELAMILKLDPMLLSNETFVAGYPDLVRFLDKNPEIRRNPRFYLGEIPMPSRASESVLDDIIESLAAVFGITLSVAAFAWLVRTIIDQRRWSRLSRTQTEVHNKILDRFGSSEELLQYIKSPAGEKFLESAPIPLHAEPAVQSSPFGRVIWSIQIGVIVAAAALGLLLVSIRHSNETGQGLFALGAIGLCIGLGFIGSAAVSMFLSRRLGLWKPVHAPTDDPGPVR
jgi:hypothetical protein